MSSARTPLLAAALAVTAALLVTPSSGAAPRTPAPAPAKSAPGKASPGKAVARTKVVPAPPGTPQASVAKLTEPSGYVESEFFLSGTADSYAEVGQWALDGRWEAEVDESGVPFTTRVVVNRPRNPKRFNGTVWVEWLNVSTGADVAPSFVQARDRILASGAAWVGVSAQRVGVEAAKKADPRYAPLDIPRDAFSYDVFTRAGEAVRTRSKQLLGGLRPRRVIAAGESQSAFRLTTYVNALHHRAPVYDGFLVHSRFAVAAPISEDGFFGGHAAKIRTDTRAPVLQLQTETDLGGWETVRQPSRGTVHTWEVAGSAHVDVHTIESTLGQAATPESVAWLMGCTRPVNGFPFRYAANAAYAALERWVRLGLRPPAAQPLEIVDDVIQRDADGNAKGGLRLPDIDVPLATHSGLGNSSQEEGDFFCSLFGTTTPFGAERLAELYPSRKAYVEAYTVRAVLAALRGHMTWADAQAAIAASKVRAVGQ